MKKHWWQSTAITGALVAAASVIASPAVTALIPAQYAWIGVAAGYVVNQWGQRKATAVNGNGQ